MFVLLSDKEQFAEYKKLLDILGNYDFDHVGKPESFPCLVKRTSYCEPNIDAPYTYYHAFVYKGENKCETCGHITVGFGENSYEDWHDLRQRLHDEM